MRTDYCLSERRRLESECGRQDDLMKARDGEIESLKAQLTVKEAEAVEAAHLRMQVSTIKAAEKSSNLQFPPRILSSMTVTSLKSQNDGLVDQVHALETTCARLREQVSGCERLKK
ncbi:hypothetical protein Tco_1390535 [Tanacetum coccineum]